MLWLNPISTTIPEEEEEEEEEEVLHLNSGVTVVRH